MEMHWDCTRGLGVYGPTMSVSSHAWAYLEENTNSSSFLYFGVNVMPIIWQYIHIHIDVLVPLGTPVCRSRAVRGPYTSRSGFQGRLGRRTTGRSPETPVHHNARSCGIQSKIFLQNYLFSQSPSGDWVATELCNGRGHIGSSAAITWSMGAAMIYHVTRKSANHERLLWLLGFNQPNGFKTFVFVF